MVAKVTAIVAAILLLMVAALGAKVQEATDCVTDTVVKGTTELLKSFDKTQLGNLSLINNIGIKLGLAVKDRVVAVAVAIQESRARNLDYGHLDSCGIFQQRAMYYDHCNNPKLSTNDFYRDLQRVEDREQKSYLNIALETQKPSRAAYLSDKNYFPGWIDDAQAFVGSASAGAEVDSGDASNADAATASESQSETASFCSAIDWPGKAGDTTPKSDDGMAPGKFIWPTVHAPVTSPYGNRYHPVDHVWRLHDGMDIGAPGGSPIYAAADGVVSSVSTDGAYGNFTTIDHGNGVMTGYGHQSRFAAGIYKGVTVKRGQVIGYVGSTGKSTGDHLHFMLHVNGTPVDPRSRL